MPNLFARWNTVPGRDRRTDDRCWRVPHRPASIQQGWPCDDGGVQRSATAADCRAHKCVPCDSLARRSRARLGIKLNLTAELCRGTRQGPAAPRRRRVQ